MAEVIVEELVDSPEALDATIYLFDRFHQRDSIDHIQFFEEFAVRTRGLGATPIGHTPAPPTAVERPVESTSKNVAAEARSEMLAGLAVLDGERQALEGRLAQYGGALARPEEKKLKERLSEIQDKRIALLSATSPRPSAAVSVFISYSHVDEELRKELGKHLKVLEHQGVIASWHDRKIGAGAEWEGVIDERLNEARIILLLVSPDFVYSQYCYDIEMKRALARHDERQALVIPVVLRAVRLKGTPFAKLQALPKDAKPVTTWADRDSAFVDVTDGLYDAIQDLIGAA
jgi:hypothetical protein